MHTVNSELPAYRVEQLGFSALSDAETISLLIGSNKLDKCRALMQSINYNLRELSKLSLVDLQELGLTKREAQIIAGALEIGRRKSLSEAEEKFTVKRSQDVADIYRQQIGDLQHEEFHAIYLNRANRIIKRIKISSGGISGTVSDVRLIIRHAIQCLASGLIVCHNHPSGTLTPSEADSRITKKIREGGELLDVQLLDHIIVTDTEHYSFADNGLI